MKNKSNIILLAFLAMGFGDVVGPMVSLAKDSFNLSNTLAQMLPFTGFLMFGLLSVPMGLYQDKKGKKYGPHSGLDLTINQPNFAKGIHRYTLSVPCNGLPDNKYRLKCKGPGHHIGMQSG